MLGACDALCSLNVLSRNEDCRLLVAGVGKGSGLMPARGVGSAGREGIALLDESLCIFFEGRPSPDLPVSKRFHAGSCSCRYAAVKLTTGAGLG